MALIISSKSPQNGSSAQSGYEILKESERVYGRRLRTCKFVARPCSRHSLDVFGQRNWLTTTASVQAEWRVWEK